MRVERGWVRVERVFVRVVRIGENWGEWRGDW